MSDDKRTSMIHQQGSYTGEFTTFMHQFGWWDFACTLQYHQTIIFLGKMVFINNGQSMLWSQKMCPMILGSKFTDLVDSKKNSIFGKKRL